MGTPPATPAPPAARLDSVDAYRGLVMFLMMAEILRLAAVAKAVPGSWLLGVLAYHQTHVEWVGCSLHDLIQPSFSFLVGVSLPYSLAARRAKGQSALAMSLHAFWRAAVLVYIGIVLRSLWGRLPDYGFTDTLSQIGLGYGFLFLFGFRPVREQWAAVAALLVGYWLFFALAPLPGPDFDRSLVGITPRWYADHGLTGFAAHWDKNTNPAADFDRWFLNQFPRESPHVFSRGGYQVLSFIPTLATMILGLIAGGVLKSARDSWLKVRWLAVAGGLSLGAGWALGELGVCPVVKRIWTPSWVLFSGGWAFLFLAGFYAATDVAGWRRWAFPLVVIGTNSIATYCMCASFIKPEVQKMVRRHVWEPVFTAFGPEYEVLVSGGLTLLVLWLVLLWMYRRRVFIKV